MNHAQLIGDFFIGISQLQTFDERFKLYEHYVQKLNFDYAAYSYIPEIKTTQKPQNFDHQPLFKLTSDYPDTFVQEYTHRHFEKDDITIKAYSENKLDPIDWWQYHKENDMSVEEHAVIEVARLDYGMENGLSIPTMKNGRGLAGASIVSTEKGDHYQRLKQENANTLIHITKMFHTIVFNEPSSYRAFLPTAFQHLSNKDKQVLQHLVNGLSLKVLEDHTGITRRYGDKLLSGMRKKLGGLSTQQLLYYAGLFDLLRD
jgi:hypothetical protein